MNHATTALVATTLVLATAGSTPAAAQCDSFVLAPTSYPTGTGPTAASFGDVDGDLVTDFAVSDPVDEMVAILHGTGQGGFAFAFSVAAGRSPQAVALGDLDGDGDLDAAVCNRGIAGAGGWQEHGFTVLWNTGGAFQNSTFVALPAAQSQPSDLELGDLDGDGDLDVVECLHGTSYPTSRVASFLNDGTGHFAAPAYATTGLDPIALTLGDYDGDGALDAVTANYTGNSFSRLHGNGNGTFATGYSQSTTYPQDAALGDFDGDGDVDLAVAYRYGVLVIRNDAGVFNWIATLARAMPQVAVSFLDLDGDGDLDLVSADQFADALVVWRGDGTGAFVFKEQVAVGNGPVAIAVRDVDADGDVDLALPLISDGAVAVVRNECPLSTYCLAKVNSQGCLPAIGSTGTPSLSGPDDFHVVAVLELNRKVGLAVFGRQAAHLPFGGGILCAAAPLVRSGGQNSGGSTGQVDCTGTYDFHVTHAWLVQHGWSAGDELFAQYWSRDPSHPDGTGVALSNALRCVLLP
jgi:hypothetical protein